MNLQGQFLLYEGMRYEHMNIVCVCTPEAGSYERMNGNNISNKFIKLDDISTY